MLEKSVPGYRVGQVWDTVLRFRSAWNRYHRPQDVNHLLRLFPPVELQRGYELDYLSLSDRDGSWIWPFVRRETGSLTEPPPGALSRIPRDQLAAQKSSPAMRQIQVDALYQYLGYESSPLGMTLYGLFVSELWALKSSGAAAEWLSLEHIFSKRDFEATLRKAGSLVRVGRPSSYDPTSQAHPEGGGEINWLVYQTQAWKRISRLQCRVSTDGVVEWTIGEVIANLG
jgi:hypothetical protein